MKKTFSIAFSGVITALALVIMYLGGVIWLFSYIAPLLVSLLMIVVTKALNKSYAFIVYFSISILSLFMLADKECALLFALFFGYYPIIKFYIDRVKFKVVNVIIKLILFNASMIIIELICVYVFNIPLDNEFGKWGIVILLLCANLVFVLYERLFSMVIVIYDKKLKYIISKYIK